jgi:hypothetical protein
MGKETEKRLQIFVPLADLKDSMLLDSGQEVLALKYKGYDVSVRVCGEVRVDYKDSRYASASQMPEELLAKFRDGSAYCDPDVNIIDNNWFEAFIDKDGEWTGRSTVVDLEDDSEEDLASGLKDMVNGYIKDRLDDAKDLLLQHAKEHQLEGVEITDEDAASVVALRDAGNTLEEAVDIVLTGIRDCLDNGLSES